MNGNENGLGDWSTSFLFFFGGGVWAFFMNFLGLKQNEEVDSRERGENVG